VGDRRAGNVFINIIEHQILGRHASIQIHVNQDQRGRGVGKAAYRLACEMSDHAEIFAHMRKSNLASRRAAESAGFAAVNDGRITQLSMVWRRPES
jgi:RimJ/RimL family protein N-acetyltransferase